MQENSISMLNVSQSQHNDETEFSKSKRKYKFNPKLIDKLRIPDIQKVLTSKTYKHQRT